jgi:predicted ATPase
MLTRIRIRGFKNLADAEVHFGPFTCFAGANAVGKSNIFDVLGFLSDLADAPIMEAAARVRDPSSKTGDARALFHRSGRGMANIMSFDLDLIVASTVTDDFGRTAHPVATFLNYQLEFRWVETGTSSRGEIQLQHESLKYIASHEADTHLKFRPSSEFRKSVIHGPGKRTAPFISTAESDTPAPQIMLHTDGGRGGKSYPIPARTSPRTVLGGVNTNSHPTVLAARREMQSWKLLQLEPSALRRPDEFSADEHLTSTGANLPSTLLRLSAQARVANKLASLIPEVREVRVDIDEGRRLRTLEVVGRDGVPYPARSLSDGTLRFLALAVLGEDIESGAVICLEEPENGVHPARVFGVVSLLRDMCVDPDAAVGPENPLRQVIINTHSPIVIGNVRADDVVFVQSTKAVGGGAIEFRAIKDTWRASDRLMSPVAPGVLLSYLGGFPMALQSRTHGLGSQATVLDKGQQMGLFTVAPPNDASTGHAELHPGT